MPARVSRAIVLTSARGAETIDVAAIDAVKAMLETERGSVRAGWLAPGRAWENLFSAANDENLEPFLNRVVACVGDSAVDVNIILDDPGSRRKRLLVADMESTIIEQEMLDELADFVGKRQEISDITERAMRGELDFDGALKERVRMLAGLDAAVLDEVAGRMTLMTGAAALVQTMKAHGAYCALVSGGFAVFASRIAERLGFDEFQANVLEIADGKLTGRVGEPILGRDAKLTALRRLTAKLGLKPQDTLAVGDGANDLAMIEAAGLGVAFRAKPKVRDAARGCEHGAVVTHGDLTSLLYLQGYQQDEITG